MRAPTASTYVRAAEPLPPYANSWIDRLEHWAEVAPDRLFLAERDASGGWRTLTYKDALDKTMRIGSWLARAWRERRDAVADPLRQQHRARAALARRHGGRRADLPGLDRLFAGLAGPRQAERRHRSDDAALRLRRRRHAPMRARWRWPSRAASSSSPATRPLREAGATPLSELIGDADLRAARAARAALTPDSIGKFLLTSGSTGHPKAVINTQRMLCSSHVMLREALPFFKEEPPVLVEWLPWAHTFGSNSSFGLILYNGGTFYFDEGRPTPRASRRRSTIFARSRQRSFSTCRRGLRSCCRICSPTTRCGKPSSRASKCSSTRARDCRSPSSRAIASCRARALARRCLGPPRSARPRPAPAPSSTCAA